MIYIKITQHHPGNFVAEIHKSKPVKNSIRLLTGVSTLLAGLTGIVYGQADLKPSPKPLLIQEQGSFAVGGSVSTRADGQTLHGDHAYVFYQIPVSPRKYPLVFAHGLGQFSKTWETTPDGREGFQTIFLRRSFGVYLVDQPRRGNAGRSTAPATLTPAFDEQLWFNRFRVGIWPNYFEGCSSKGSRNIESIFPPDDTHNRPAGF